MLIWGTALQFFNIIWGFPTFNSGVIVEDFSFFGIIPSSHYYYNSLIATSLFLLVTFLSSADVVSSPGSVFFFL